MKTIPGHKPVGSGTESVAGEVVVSGETAAHLVPGQTTGTAATGVGCHSSLPVGGVAALSTDLPVPIPTRR